MPSDAELKAERDAFAEDMTDLEVMVVGHFGVGTAREKLNENGAADVYRHARSRGMRPGRAQGEKPVEEGEFLRRMTGATVTCKGILNDRELAREGAEAIWSASGEAGWKWSKLERWS